MQTSFSRFFNNIFKYLTIFLLTFVWINFYIKKLNLSLIISALSTLFIGFILKLINNKKQYKLNIKNKEKKLIEECSHQFIFSDENLTKNFFVSLLKNNYTVNLENNYVVVENQTNKTLFLPIYNTLCITCNNIINAYRIAKKMKINNIIIVCKTFNEESQNLINSISDIKIKLLDENLTYKYILQPAETYPNFSIELKKVEKLQFREIKKIAFNKAKTKSYLISGTLLMFSSFFTKYNVYYVIMASILFCFALYSTFNNNYNKVDKNGLF